MIDVHAHLHESQLIDQIEQILKNFTDEGGRIIVNSPVDLESVINSLGFTSKHSQIYTTAGIHPEITISGGDIYVSAVSNNWIEKNIEQLSTILDKHSEIIGIGECGLDYYWVKKERLENREKIFSLQKKLLELQLKLAIKHDLPVVLHCRDLAGDKQCEAELIKLIIKTGKGKLKGIFHSYTGSLSYLEQILAHGFYVSFNGIVTYKNAENVRELLDNTPLDRLFIESDAPLLVPNRERSAGIKLGEPAHVKSVAEFVAQKKGVTSDRLWSIIGENFEKLFGKKMSN